MLCSCLMEPPPYPSLTRQATQKAGSGAKFPGGRGGRGTRERGGGERGGGRRGGGEHPVFEGWCAMKEGLVVLRKERGQEVEAAIKGGRWGREGRWVVHRDPRGTETTEKGSGGRGV